MASIKSFITISLLSNAHPEDLAKLLAPMKEELQSNNLWTIDNKGIDTFDFNKLAHYLHEKCPQEIEDKLFAFHSIAKDVLYDEIKRHLEEIGIEPNVTDDIYQVACTLVLKDLKRCNMIASKRLAEEQHCYTHFRPQTFQQVDDISQMGLDKIKSDLASFFANTGKSDHLEIYKHIIGKYSFYCISHGAPKTRENSVGEVQKVHTFRPELVDIVRINLMTGEISIFAKKSSSKKLRANYCKIFGNAILPLTIYEPNAKYNLNNLKNKNALTTGELSTEIAYVSVKAIDYKNKVGCLRRCSQNVSMEYLTLSEDEDIQSFTLEFTLRNSHQKYAVRIAGVNRSEFPNGCDEELIESFFAQNGFLIDNSDENLSEMATREEDIAV